MHNAIYLATAAGMVLLNAFFVAAEFGLVKVREGQLEGLVKEGKPFARTARWLGARLDTSLSACQLGITMASLGLGWVGEPAFAELLKPAFACARDHVDRRRCILRPSLWRFRSSRPCT